MTLPTLRPGTTSPDVCALQRLLQERLQLDPPLEVTGEFRTSTLEAVYALQASSIGPDGRPLTVDGVVGPLTWWALVTETQDIAATYGPTVGASRHELGAAVVEHALREMRSGARERGRDNAGADVERYFAPLGRSEGNWCAALASSVVHAACHELGVDPPFEYSGTARGILAQLEEIDEPLSGDLAFWWRVAPLSWQGHVEIVTHFADGVLWTIGGNRGRYPAPVRQFTYVVERESKMLGFGKI